MKRQLPLVGLILLLTGCQSEFDKCMDTELPRAEVLAGIETERMAGKRLDEVRDLTLKIINVDKGIKCLE